MKVYKPLSSSIQVRTRVCFILRDRAFYMAFFKLHGYIFHKSILHYYFFVIYNACAYTYLILIATLWIIITHFMDKKMESQ